MQLVNYIELNELKMIHFSFSLIKEVDEKIKSKTFFYKNQISHYVNECVDHFLTSLHVKTSLQTVYKAEIHQLIKLKLKQIYQKYQLFTCV